MDAQKRQILETMQEVIALMLNPQQPDYKSFCTQVVEEMAHHLGIKEHLVDNCKLGIEQAAEFNVSTFAQLLTDLVFSYTESKVEEAEDELRTKIEHAISELNDAVGTLESIL